MGSDFQQIGSISNAYADNESEQAGRLFFAQTGISLQRGFTVPVGCFIKKPHEFDLGSEDPPILVECKSYPWASGDNSPSAKISGVNEVMLLFSLAPERYRKILFLLKRVRQNETLAPYYIKTQGHLIGPKIEIWEFDLEARHSEKVFPEHLTESPPFIPELMAKEEGKRGDPGLRKKIT